MKIKNTNKYLLLILFIFISSFLGAHSVLALEVKYPNLTAIGLPDINQKNIDIVAFVKYFFGLGIYLAAVLALISFTIGAVRLISPSIEQHNDAKSQMKDAVLGLVLTLASFIIIQTINPALKTPYLAQLPPGVGVAYSNGDLTKRIPVLNSNSDTSTVPAGFNALVYCCNSACNGGTGNAKLVWLFPNTQLEPGNPSLSNVRVWRLQCGYSVPITGYGSFKIADETPGVYYCLNGCNGNNCATGYISESNIISQDNIDSIFNKKILGVKILNDPSHNLYYGAVFHSNTRLDSGGTCTLPIINDKSDGNSICTPVTSGISSAVDIFLLNKTPYTSGTGVNFYSGTFGKAVGTTGGKFSVINSGNGSSSVAAISNLLPSYSINASQMYFDYSGTDVLDVERNKVRTFRDLPRSIQIIGSYLVGVYSSSSYCQTFTKTIDNLNSQPFLASSGSKVDSVYIIPIISGQ